jgi:hypothetical protein
MILWILGRLNLISKPQVRCIKMKENIIFCNEFESKEPDSSKLVSSMISVEIQEDYVH